MHSPDRPTRVRYLVLAMLCSLGFLTYLDRICLARVQNRLAEDLGFDQFTPEAERQLRDGATDRYESILKKEDKKRLAKAEQLDDDTARRTAAEERLRRQMKNDRLKWVFMAFVFGYMLFEVPGGWLGDRWGPRVVIFRIVVWWSVFTVLTGSVDSLLGWLVSSPSLGLMIAGLIVVRFLFGLGEAGAYPNVGRALARWLPYRERAFGLGAIWMASRFGGAFAPLITGVLMLWAGGWREVFWIFGGIGIVWAAGFLAWFRNRPEEKTTVNSAEIALIRSSVAGVGTVYDDHRHGGLSWWKLFTSPNLWAIYITAAAVSFSWYINITFLPGFLNDRFDIDFESREMEVMNFLPLFISAFTCLAGGALSDWLVRRTGSRRWGRSALGVLGFALAGVCDLSILFVDHAWGVVALICLACAVQDLALPALWAAGADIGGRYAGTLLGTMNAMGCVGALLSPLLTANISEYGNWDHAFLLFAGTYVLGALLWLRIDASAQLIEAPSPTGGREEPA